MPTCLFKGWLSGWLLWATCFSSSLFSHFLCDISTKWRPGEMQVTPSSIALVNSASFARYLRVGTFQICSHLGVLGSLQTHVHLPSRPRSCLCEWCHAPTAVWSPVATFTPQPCICSVLSSCYFPFFNVSPLIHFLPFWVEKPLSTPGPRK